MKMLLVMAPMVPLGVAAIVLGSLGWSAAGIACGAVGLVWAVLTVAIAPSEWWL